MQKIGYYQLATDRCCGDNGINNIEVVLITFGGNCALVDSVFDGTARFVAMGAVGEMAIVKTRTHLWKEM